MRSDSMLSTTPRPRRSGCAARSRAQEQERLRALSVQTRIEAALTMRARFAWLQPRMKAP